MLRKMQAEKCHQRFALRKLSVGVVSVLVGVTLFGVNLAGTDTVAKADVVPTSNTAAQNEGNSASAVTLSSSQASTENSASQSNQSSTSSTSSDQNEAAAVSSLNPDTTTANVTSTTDSSTTSSNSNDNVANVRVRRAAVATDTTNYDVDDIYNYYSSNRSTSSDPISKQKIQDLIDYKNNMSSVTAILNLDATSYGVAWVDQALNKDLADPNTLTDIRIGKIITTYGNQLVTKTNSKIDEQLTKLTELQQQYPNSEEVKNAIDKLNEAKTQVTLENIYNAEKMEDVIDTLNKYGSVSAYDKLEEAAKNDQTSGTGELDSAKTDAKAAIDQLANLNDAQKAAAKGAIDNATTPNDVTTAQSDATILDGKMGDLATSVSDVDTIKATGNYTNASEAAKQAYDDAVAKAQAILDETQGMNENADAVAAAKQAVEAAKQGLDGDSKLADAKTAAKTAIDRLENLNDAQKAAAKDAVDQATTPNDVMTAQSDATILDGKMGDLATSVSDVDTIKATGNYTNASEAAKQAYDDAVAKAQAILDKVQGTNEDAEVVAAAKQAVEDAKKGLDGDSKLADAKTAAKGAIDQLENLNDAQKAAAKEAIDNATTPNDVTTAQDNATTLNGKMGDLATSVSDVEAIKATGNYTNASEAAKQAYNDAVAKAQAILDKSNGNNASASEVMAAKQAVDNAKKALNGKTNASGQEGNEDAMTKGTTSTPVTESSASATSQQSGSQTASKQLPQTGDDTSQALVTFGLGGTLLGLLGIASRKRKKLN